MSTLVNLTANTVTIQGFQLLEPTDMLTALEYLTTQGYQGTLNAEIVGGTKYSLNLYHPQMAINQVAYINDWIILQNGSIATVVAANKFDIFYTLT